MTKANRDELIQKWNESVKVLSEARKAESELRDQVLKAAFNFKGDDREGTENIELGNDYKLKAVFKLSRSVNNAKIQKALDKMEKSGPEGEFLADRLINWKASLNKKEFDALPTNYRRMVEPAITSKPGKPSLTLVCPKSK